MRACFGVLDALKNQDKIMTGSIISTGLTGIQGAMAQLAHEAEKISRPDTFAGNDVDPVSSMINMKTAIYQANASAKVVKVGKELNDSVLDILA